MDKRKRCRAANYLAATAVIAWLTTAAIAAQRWHEAVHGRTAAVGAFAAALTVAAIVVNTRQTVDRGTRVVTVAVARAPRASYWRGYEDRGSDMAAGDIDADTTDLMAIRR